MSVYGGNRSAAFPFSRVLPDLLVRASCTIARYLNRQPRKTIGLGRSISRRQLHKRLVLREHSSPVAASPIVYEPPLTQAFSFLGYAVGRSRHRLPAGSPIRGIAQS